MSQRKIKKQRSQKPGTSDVGKLSHGLYMQAESFFQSSGLLFHNATQIGYNPQFIFPSIVCQAFALELYLKCLIVIEGRDYPGTHDPAELFGILTKESRAAIESGCRVDQQQRFSDAFHQQSKTPGPPPAVTFQSMLNASRKAFDALRYVHEGNTLSTGEGWQGGPIVTAVREHLISLHPEWRNFRFVDVSPPQAPPPASPAP